MEKRYVTVSALNKYLKAKFIQDEQLSHIYIKGEISNLKYHSSGHCYFTLKDQNSRVNAVMFANQVKKLKFRLEDGMHVFIEGSVSIYEASGQYQIYAQSIIIDGVGELYLQYEQLKKKLEGLDYFNIKHKKALPLIPNSIGIITGNKTAALKDILRTIYLRYPQVNIYIIPTLVQGEQAASRIAKAIFQADTYHFDAILLARGGGSIEDLWAFNEEIVAKAVFEAKTPIVSAIGHESDVVLSDFVADKRAATPTAGAALLVPDRVELLSYLMKLKQSLNKSIQHQILTSKIKLEKVSKHYLLGNPEVLYQDELLKIQNYSDKLKSYIDKQIKQQQVFFYSCNQRINHTLDIYLLKQNNLINDYNKRVNYSIKHNLKDNSELYLNLNARLKAFSPLGVLKRGYSYIEKNNQMIKSSNELKSLDEVEIIFHDGRKKAIIKS